MCNYNSCNNISLIWPEAIEDLTRDTETRTERMKKDVKKTETETWLRLTLEWSEEDKQQTQISEKKLEDNFIFLKTGNGC